MVRRWDEYKRVDQAGHGPVFHRGDRLADQLDRADHAVQPGPVPRPHDPGPVRALEAAAAQAAGGPGIMQGGIGWQGIIPARAAKMGSISVDKAIAKLGTPAEFFQELEPDKIAEQMVVMFEPEIPEIVDRTMSARAARAVARRAAAGQAGHLRARAAAAARRSCTRSSTRSALYIDQLLDPKLMVIDHFEKNPALVNRIFKDFGATRAEADGELRLPVRLPARDPGGDHHPLRHELVAAAAARRVRRVDDEPARDVGDLRAGRGRARSARSSSTGCSCAARPRRPRSTRGSSPTRW